jgi:hypothetical protein
LIPFDRMADKLKNPTNNKQQKRPAPVEEEERQGDNNHRNADAVRQPVQRMLMFRFVICEKILRHMSELDNLDKNIHRATANHSLFTRLISSQGEVVQLRFAATHA